MKFSRNPDFREYLNSLMNRAAHCGLSVDDLPGLTGYRLRTVWATLSGSSRYFSVMCLRAIENVIRQKEALSK